MRYATAFGSAQFACISLSDHYLITSLETQVEAHGEGQRAFACRKIDAKRSGLHIEVSVQHVISCFEHVNKLCCAGPIELPVGACICERVTRS